MTATASPRTVLERLTALLDEKRIAYEILRHAPVFTSEEAARERGTSLASGAKALVCKADERFVLFVLGGDRRLDGRKVRRALRVRSLRFATREEVFATTALTPGAIPPFGQLFGLASYCDSGLSAQPRINFNAGDHAVSVSVAYADYLTVEQPACGTYAADP